MTREVNITIINNLEIEKRDMTIYHHATKSAHMISHNSSITLPLKSAIEDDYLHISIVSGPGNLLNQSVVNLPSWVDFELSSVSNANVSHLGDRVLLIIPPGPPTWQLKMKQPLSFRFIQQVDYITIGDNQIEYHYDYKGGK